MNLKYKLLAKNIFENQQNLKSMNPINPMTDLQSNP